MFICSLRLHKRYTVMNDGSFQGPKGDKGPCGMSNSGSEGSFKESQNRSSGWLRNRSSILYVHLDQPHQGRCSEGYSWLIQNHLVFCLDPHCPWLVHLPCDKDQQEQMPCLAGIPQKGSMAWQPKAFKGSFHSSASHTSKYLNSQSEHKDPVSSWQVQI